MTFISQRSAKVLNAPVLNALETYHSFTDRRNSMTAFAQIKSLTVRVPTWKLVASGVKPPAPPTSSSNMQSNCSAAEVVSIVSELLGPEGIPRSKFDKLFVLCDGCERVMPKLGQVDHGCMVEVRSSDSELSDDISNLLRE